MVRSTWRGAAYLSLAASIWGGMFVMVRVATSVIPPVPLVWLRYLTAAVAIFLFGVARGVSWHVSAKDWRLIFLIGLMGQTISIVTQETGTMMTSAQMGSIITAATPAFMVIFARLILHEALTPGRILSVALATAGVLAIVAGPGEVEMGSFWGSLSLVVAALTWALMSILPPVSDGNGNLLRRPGGAGASRTPFSLVAGLRRERGDSCGANSFIGAVFGDRVHLRRLLSLEHGASGDGCHGERALFLFPASGGDALGLALFGRGRYPLVLPRLRAHRCRRSPGDAAVRGYSREGRENSG